jgi:hypothetical protein
MDINQCQIIMDDSRYEALLVPSEMPEVGGYIHKAGQCTTIDSTFVQHCNETANYPTGAYWWIDPIVSASPQIAAIRNTVKCKTMVLDIEQWWADWIAWNQYRLDKIPVTSVPKLSGVEISTCGKVIAEALVAAGYHVVIYTRMSFVNEYAPQMLAWMGNYDLMLAQYPYGAPSVVTSWTDVLHRWFPPVLKYWPVFNGKRAKVWQISGDKFKLPGAYGDTKKLYRSAVDISLFEGTADELAAWFGGTTPATTPTPAPVNPVYKLTAWYRWSRVEPGGAKLSHIYYRGKTFTVTKTLGGWGQIGPYEWINISDGMDKG